MYEIVKLTGIHFHAVPDAPKFETPDDARAWANKYNLRNPGFLVKGRDVFQLRVIG